jgi:hypothetical protein
VLLVDSLDVRLQELSVDVGNVGNLLHHWGEADVPEVHPVKQRIVKVRDQYLLDRLSWHSFIPSREITPVTFKSGPSV